MDTNPGTPYQLSTEAFERCFDAQTATIPTVGLGLTALDLPSLCTGNSRFTRSLADDQSLLSPQRQHYEDLSWYPSLSSERENGPQVPIDVSASAASDCYTPSYISCTPYVPSYQFSPNEHLEKWQQRAEMHAPTPFYAPNTPVSHFDHRGHRLLMLQPQDTFSAIDVDAISPAEIESENSRWSFDSWSNCPTPQAVSYFHYLCTPEVKKEQRPIEQLQNIVAPKRPLQKKYSRTAPASKSHPTLISPALVAKSIQRSGNVTSVVSAIGPLTATQTSNIIAESTSRTEHRSSARGRAAQEPSIGVLI